jgi:hypothetical protein
MNAGAFCFLSQDQLSPVTEEEKVKVFMKSVVLAVIYQVERER